MIVSRAGLFGIIHSTYGQSRSSTQSNRVRTCRQVLTHPRPIPACQGPPALHAAIPVGQGLPLPADPGWQAGPSLEATCMHPRFCGQILDFYLTESTPSFFAAACSHVLVASSLVFSQQYTILPNLSGALVARLGRLARSDQRQGPAKQGSGPELPPSAHSYLHFHPAAILLDTLPTPDKDSHHHHV